MADRNYRIRGHVYRLMGVWGGKWHLQRIDEPGSHYSTSVVELTKRSWLVKHDDDGRATIAGTILTFGVSATLLAFVGSIAAHAAQLLGGVS